MSTHTPEQDTAGSADAALRRPLSRFRIAAYVTGVGLLALCLVMVLRYGFGNPEPSAVYSPIHGVLYMIYVAFTIDLAIKARWSVKGAIGVLLAGCVPFLSFVVERAVTARVRTGRRI